MSFQVFERLKLTEGERARFLAYLVVAVSSGALGFLAVLHLDKTALFDAFTWYQTWIVLASSLGGMIALFLAGDRVGQPGVSGALRGAAGGLWVTMIGALIGGTLSLPLYGTMFGPFVVAVTLASTPILFALWVCNLVGVHVLMATYNRERDTIFANLEGAQPRRLPLATRLRERFS